MLLTDSKLELKAWWAITWGYWAFLSATLLSINPWTWLSHGEQIAAALNPQASLSSAALHFGAYAVLSLLLAIANTHRDGRVLLCWLLAACAHGVVFELLQEFVPRRFPNSADIAANCVGVAVGWIFPRVWILRLKRPFRT